MDIKSAARAGIGTRDDACSTRSYIAHLATHWARIYSTDALLPSTLSNPVSAARSDGTASHIAW